MPEPATLSELYCAKRKQEMRDRLVKEVAAMKAEQSELARIFPDEKQRARAEESW